MLRSVSLGASRSYSDSIAESGGPFCDTGLGVGQGAVT
jgi:hypothetical protein